MSSHKSPKGSNLLLLALLCAFLGGTWYLSHLSGKEEAVKHFISSLPGKPSVQKVSVGVFSNEIVLHDFKGMVELPSAEPMAFAVKRLTLRDINRQALTEPGTQKLAGYVRVEDLSLKGARDSTILMAYSELFFGDLEMDGIWVDVQALLQTAQQGISSDAFTDFLLSLKFGPCTGKNNWGVMAEMPSELGLSFPAGTRVTAESYRAGSYGVTFGNDMVLYGYSLEFPSGSRMFFAEMGMDSYTLPADMYRWSIKNAMSGNTDMNEEDALAMLRQGFSFKNLYVKGMDIALVDVGTLKADAAFCDFTMSGGELNINLTAKAFTLPASILGTLYYGASPEESTAIFGRENFVLDTRHVLSVRNAPEERIRIVYEEDVEERTLGSSSQVYVLSSKKSADPNSPLPVDFMSLTFDNCSVRLRDTGMLDLFFALAALDANEGCDPDDEEMAPVTPDMIRQELAEELRGFPLPDDSPLNKVLDDVAQFLLHGGALSITAEPPAGVHLMPLFSDPSPLFTMPVSSQYDSAAKAQ